MVGERDIFEDFAARFTGEYEGEEKLAHIEVLICAGRLDYSVESLKLVDQYLQYLHDHRPAQMGRDWVNTILWGGAYVGEVIRRESERRYDWVDFDDWLAEYPDHAQLLGTEKELQVCAILGVGDGSFTLPLNKVFKFILNGREDSVWFYADTELKSKSR